MTRPAKFETSVAPVLAGALPRLPELSAKQGLTVTQNLQLHDTAVAAAGTDAFSRACKMFGPALGSDLYDGNPTPSARSGASSTARPTTAPGARKGPSDAQRGVLGRLGYSDEAIDAMPYATWKGYVDTYFNNRNKKVIRGART